MISKLKRLDFAHIGCKASILVQGMPEDESIQIGCFGYLFEHNGKKILIDTGIENIDIVNLTKSSKDDWTRDATEGNLIQNLNKVDILPEEIEEVYVTHSHYDHISGLCHLVNATVHMSKKEYDYLCFGENPHRHFLHDIIPFLEKKNAQGKLVLVGDEYVEDDVQCITVGGHTPGSMIVQVDEYLFTGDSIFLLENVEKQRPIGFCKEPEKALRAMEICCQHKGTVLTGHDYRCTCDI